MQLHLSSPTPLTAAYQRVELRFLLTCHVSLFEFGRAVGKAAGVRVLNAGGEIVGRGMRGTYGLGGYPEPGLRGGPGRDGRCVAA